MQLNVGEIEQIFFMAMRAGYAAEDAVETSLPGMPGSKVIEYRQGGYLVKDCWFVIPDSPYSFGQTIIWQNSIPVWQMNYMGYYKKVAIPFLKRALRENYERGIFHGGRGPKHFQSGEIEYYNNADASGFERFFGKESIYRNHVTALGWHQYQGSILFPTEEWPIP